MSGGLMASITGAVQAALANLQFRGVVAHVTAGRVYVVRPGQTAPDRIGYVCVDAVDPTLLSPGDIVSVIQHGASYLVMGKVSTTVAPPPPLGPPATATGVYLGVLLYPDPSVSGFFFTEQEFELAVGRQMAIIGTERDWAARGTIGSGVIPTVPGRTTVPLLSWSPWDSAAGADESAYTLAAITAGAFDTYLTAQAHTLASYARPTLLRFAPEMNGTAFPWCGDSAGFITAWRHVHDLVTAIAPLTQWVWCPFVWGGSDPTVQDPQPWYPGDDYVDWVGLDGFNSVPLTGQWQTFTELFGFSYGQLVSAHTKPLLLGAWGCDADARKPAWLTSALTVEIPRFFPQLAAFCYVNQDRRGTDGLGTDWPVDADAAVLAAFSAGIGGGYYLDVVGG